MSFEELFFNYFNNQKNISEKLNEFFGNKTLVATFQVNTTYKKFILNKIKEFYQKIVVRRSPILKNKLSKELIAQIKGYSQDIFDSLTPDWFIKNIFESRNIRKKRFLNYIYNFFCKNTLEVNILPLGEIAATQEKGRLLVYDNLEQRIYDLLSQQVYKQFFSTLISVLRPIKTLQEITNTPKLNTHNTAVSVI